MRRVVGCVIALVILAGHLPAFEAQGTIKSVDPDKGVVVVHARALSTLI